MTTFDTGRHAEDVAAEYLRAQGYCVLEQNWRTRYCEIDIVALKDNTVYFVEVKYRRTNNQGGGLDYITPQKLKQMHFAAEMWVGNNNWRGDYSLAGIEVSGNNYTVNDLIINL